MKLKLILILTVSFFLSSCSVGNYVRQGFDNLTTYFNTYYNAQKIFKVAEREIKSQQKDIFTSKIYNPSGNVINNLVSVIEKCSKILQYHQKSSLVDDALFLIGKSYYYQREYPSAIRKFTELITNFSNSSFYLESKLFIARSYINTQDFDRAQRLLNEVYEEALAKRNKKIQSQALLETILINFKKENHDEIIRLGEEFINLSSDDEAIGQVLIQMGNSYSKLNKLEDAVNSFKMVNRYTSDNFYKFKSQLELAEVYRKLNDVSSSESILKKLLAEANYQEYKDFVELEYAYLKLSNGDTTKALDYFVRVDTTYGNRETAGLAQFELANYFENILGNLDSAKYYYDKCQRTQIPIDILKQAQKKSAIINKYKNLWNNITTLQKQVIVLRTFPIDSTYVPMGDIEIDSTMLNDSAYLADIKSYYEEKRISDSLYFEKLKRDSANYLINLKNADSLEVNISRLHFELATLFLLDFEKPDSALPHLNYVVTKTPDREFSEQAFYALANYYDKIGQKAIADSLFYIMYNGFQDSEISKIVSKKLNLPPRTTKKNSIELEYYQGEKLVEQGKYLDALKHFNKLLSQYENTDHEPKILLMIGYICEEKLLMNDSAYSTYKMLKSKYPASLHAQKINPKIIAYESEQIRKEQEKINEKEPEEPSNEKQEILENPDGDELIENPDKKPNGQEKRSAIKSSENPRTRKK